MGKKINKPVTSFRNMSPGSVKGGQSKKLSVTSQGDDKNSKKSTSKNTQKPDSLHEKPIPTTVEAPSPKDSKEAKDQGWAEAAQKNSSAKSSDPKGNSSRDDVFGGEFTEEKKDVKKKVKTTTKTQKTQSVKKAVDISAKKETKLSINKNDQFIKFYKDLPNDIAVRLSHIKSIDPDASEEEKQKTIEANSKLIDEIISLSDNLNANDKEIIDFVINAKAKENPEQELEFEELHDLKSTQVQNDLKLEVFQLEISFFNSMLERMAIGAEIESVEQVNSYSLSSSYEKGLNRELNSLIKENNWASDINRNILNNASKWQKAVTKSKASQFDTKDLLSIAAFGQIDKAIEKARIEILSNPDKEDEIREKLTNDIKELSIANINGKEVQVITDETRTKVLQQAFGEKELNKIKKYYKVENGKLIHKDPKISKQDELKLQYKSHNTVRTTLSPSLKELAKAEDNEDLDLLVKESVEAAKDIRGNSEYRIGLNMIKEKLIKIKQIESKNVSNEAIDKNIRLINEKLDLDSNDGINSVEKFDKQKAFDSVIDQLKKKYYGDKPIPKDVLTWFKEGLSKLLEDKSMGISYLDLQDYAKPDFVALSKKIKDYVIDYTREQDSLEVEKRKKLYFLKADLRKEYSDFLARPSSIKSSEDLTSIVSKAKDSAKSLENDKYRVHLELIRERLIRLKSFQDSDTSISDQDIALEISKVNKELGLKDNPGEGENISKKEAIDHLVKKVVALLEEHKIQVSNSRLETIQESVEMLADDKDSNISYVDFHNYRKSGFRSLTKDIGKYIMDKSKYIQRRELTKFINENFTNTKNAKQNKKEKKEE